MGNIVNSNGRSMRSKVIHWFPHRKEPGMYVVTAKEVANDFAEAYREYIENKEHNGGDPLKTMCVNFNDRLVRAHTGHAFYIYYD